MFAHRTNQQNQLQNRFSFGYVFCWLSFAPISVPEALKISVDECVCLDHHQFWNLIVMMMMIFGAFFSPKKPKKKIDVKIFFLDGFVMRRPKLRVFPFGFGTTTTWTIIIHLFCLIVFDKVNVVWVYI